ncbi:DUF1523 family protein [Mangrovicoccus algicola]|uniref:DUF1523 family protein n=1 Tax=Mangrovicoccus algicola TaxID=2771008 RepID=A0A8J7CYM5_9RHOB|nr:DUF1523 family protein [Mangrovicoccus algicola]MBE3639747.1 DUF1523 family protein [Mangrovicoccus algicola]
MMRKLSLILFAAIILIVACFLGYTLPRQYVVRVVNTEIQRIDTSGSWFYANSEASGADGTRDVKMIQTIRDGGRPKVFRNEDTGWGWPPYFKFDSANVQAQASDMTSSADNPNWVLVKSYGWRSELFSIYPNVLKLRPIDSPADKPWPVFNIIVILALIVLCGLVYRAIHKFWDRRVDPMIGRVADVFDGDDDREGPNKRAPVRNEGWFRR